MDHPPRTVCHQFPLRPDYLAQALVPVDLSRAEADRLCAFIMALAQDDPPDRAAAELAKDPS